MDTERLQTATPQDGPWKVLGWTLPGSSAPSNATLFRPGDEVFYAGAIGRPGTNAPLHLADERIVGTKPRTLDWAEAASLTLTP